MPVIYVPRERDQVEDICLLSEALSVSEAELFSQDGSAAAIVDGVPVLLTPTALGDIIQ